MELKHARGSDVWCMVHWIKNQERKVQCLAPTCSVTRSKSYWFCMLLFPHPLLIHLDCKPFGAGRIFWVYEQNLVQWGPDLGCVARHTICREGDTAVLEKVCECMQWSPYFPYYCSTGLFPYPSSRTLHISAAHRLPRHQRDLFGWVFFKVAGQWRQFHFGSIREGGQTAAESLLLFLFPSLQLLLFLTLWTAKEYGES